MSIVNSFSPFLGGNGGSSNKSDWKCTIVKLTTIIGESVTGDNQRFDMSSYVTALGIVPQKGDLILTIPSDSSSVIRRMDLRMSTCTYNGNTQKLNWNYNQEEYDYPCVVLNYNSHFNNIDVYYVRY